MLTKYDTLNLGTLKNSNFVCNIFIKVGFFDLKIVIQFFTNAKHSSRLFDNKLLDSH